MTDAELEEIESQLDNRVSSVLPKRLIAEIRRLKARPTKEEDQIAAREHTRSIKIWFNKQKQGPIQIAPTLKEAFLAGVDYRDRGKG